MTTDAPKKKRISSFAIVTLALGALVIAMILTLIIRLDRLKDQGILPVVPSVLPAGNAPTADPT